MSAQTNTALLCQILIVFSNCKITLSPRRRIRNIKNTIRKNDTDLGNDLKTAVMNEHWGPEDLDLKSRHAHSHTRCAWYPLYFLCTVNKHTHTHTAPALYRSATAQLLRLSHLIVLGAAVAANSVSAQSLSAFLCRAVWKMLSHTFQPPSILQA